MIIPFSRHNIILKKYYNIFFIKLFLALLNLKQATKKSFLREKYMLLVCRKNTSTTMSLGKRKRARIINKQHLTLMELSATAKTLHQKKKRIIIKS